METAEEPVNVAPVEEVAEPAAEPAEPDNQTQAQPEAEAQPEGEAAAPDLYALLLAEAGDLDNPQLDEVAKTITAETIREADPATKALYRAVLRQAKAEETKRAEAAAAREAEIAKREAEIKALAKRTQQQRQALLDMAAKAPTAPAAAPEADPFTKEGQLAIAEYNARKVAAEAWAPILTEREQAAKANAWNALVEKYPDLADPAIGGDGGEFDKFFQARNPQLDKGIVAMNANDAADLYFNQRELERLRAQAAKANEVRTADRAAAARAVGRSAGAGAPDAAAKVAEILKRDGWQAAAAFARDNPTARDAFIKAQGIA